MSAVSILRAMHEIYESHDGGTIRLTVEEENAIFKLIQQGQNLPMHSVSVSDFVNCVKCGKNEGKGKTKQCDTCLMDGIV